MNPVVIIGGGPAGIAAACALAERREKAVLLERAPRLGGRAASFPYPRMNEEIDDGQHVLFGACSETIDLLQQVGEAGSLAFQPAMRVPIAWPGGGSVLRSARLPSALHLVPSLLSYPALSPRERLAVLRAGLSLRRGSLPEDVTFSAWLSTQGQSAGAIAALWEPITIATLNARCDQAAARAAGFIFREGILRRGGARLGFFTRPLSSIFAAAAAHAEVRGGHVRTLCGVRRILVRRNEVQGVETSDGERVVARAVIAAIPPRDLTELLPDRLRNVSPFAGLPRIPMSPIVNLHLWFDRPVLAEPFVVAIRSQLQAVFDVTRIHGSDGPIHLVISQSAASAWIDQPTGRVRDELLDALRGLFPAAREARLLDALVIRKPRATVLLAPGIDRHRPATGTPLRGLFLAGDATRGGWPSTIEGAVRSGRAAARAVD